MMKASELTFFFLWLFCDFWNNRLLLLFDVNHWLVLLSCILTCLFLQLVWKFRNWLMVRLALIFLTFIFSFTPFRVTLHKKMTLQSFRQIAFVMKVWTLSVMTRSFSGNLLLRIILHIVIVLVTRGRSILTMLLILMFFPLPLYLILLTFIIGIKRRWLLI